MQVVPAGREGIICISRGEIIWKIQKETRAGGVEKEASMSDWSKFTVDFWNRGSFELEVNGWPVE